MVWVSGLPVSVSRLVANSVVSLISLRLPLVPRTLEEKTEWEMEYKEWEEERRRKEEERKA